MQPEDFGITIPVDLIEKDFREGFAHGMESNKLTIFRKSYAEGFRAAKLLCKEIRKQRGIVDFPMKARIKFKARDGDES